MLFFLNFLRFGAIFMQMRNKMSAKYVLSRKVSSAFFCN